MSEEEPTLEEFVKDVRDNIHKEYPSLLDQANDILEDYDLPVSAREVKLSGSYANGDPTEDSDIDIAVYYTGDPEVKDEDLAELLAGNLHGKFGLYDVHPVRMNQKHKSKLLNK